MSSPTIPSILLSTLRRRAALAAGASGRCSGWHEINGCVRRGGARFALALDPQRLARDPKDIQQHEQDQSQQGELRPAVSRPPFAWLVVRHVKCGALTGSGRRWLGSRPSRTCSLSFTRKPCSAAIGARQGRSSRRMRRGTLALMRRGGKLHLALRCPVHRPDH